MFCKNCGQENAEDLNFCQKCGTSLAQAEQPVEQQPVEQQSAEQPVAQESVADTAGNTYATDEMSEEKPKVNIVGLLMKIGIPVIALALVLIIGISLFTPPKYDITTNGVTYSYDYDNEDTTIVLNDKVLGDKIDGSANVVTNFDSTTMAALVRDGESDGNVLYVITAKQKTQVSDEVDSSSYKMASSGDGLIYMTVDEELYLYDVAKKKSEKITDETVYDVAISPDGKTVLYSIVEEEDEDDDEETYKLFIYRNGKSQELAKNMHPVAVANSGKYIYAYKETEEYDLDLYSVNLKGETEKIRSEIDGFMLNKDHSEILFMSNDKTYLKVKNKEAESILSNSGRVLLPRGVASSSFSYNISSFLKQAYISDNSVYYVKNADERYRVGKKDVTSAKISEDGKTAYYVRNDSLYRVPVKEDAEETRLAKEVDTDVYTPYEVNPSGKGVYFIDDDQILRYTTKGDESDRVADDVEDITISSKGIVFYISDDQLYSSKNGAKGTKVSTKDDEIVSVYNSGKYTYYTTLNDDNEMSVFVSDGSAKFKTVLEKVSQKSGDNFSLSDYDDYADFLY